MIGLASYLLINFWWTRLQANKSAILAFTMNRVGDMGLSIGFFSMFALFGSLDYSTVFSLAPFMNETAITIIGLLLLTGAMAKSAQIPLHTWLANSMEGRQYPRLYAFIIFLNIISISLLLCFYINFQAPYSFTEIHNSFTNAYSLKLITHKISVSTLPLPRDKLGRFIRRTSPMIPLPLDLKAAMYG